MRKIFNGTMVCVWRCMGVLGAPENLLMVYDVNITEHSLLF